MAKQNKEKAIKLGLIKKEKEFNLVDLEYKGKGDHRCLDCNILLGEGWKSKICDACYHKRKCVIPYFSNLKMEKQLKKLLQAVLQQNNKKGYYEFTRIRNAMMLTLSFVLGLRPKECYNSKLSYLNLEKQTFFIPSENNKERYQDTINIPNFLLPKLETYLKYRKIFFDGFPGSNPSSSNQWLFPSRSKHQRLNRTHYNKIFRQALKTAGLYRISYIDKQGLKRASLTPYSLRAGFGTKEREE